MSNRFQFELASPEKLLVKKQVVMAMVPGSDGLFGVLAGHAPMMSSVGTGVVEVYENDDHTVTARYFVAGGFAEVETDGRCTVLAEQVIPVADLVFADIEKEVASVEEELAEIEMAEDREPVMAKLAVVQAKLAAVA